MPRPATLILTYLAGLRQCVVYDSNSPDARLIGVEYMIPKEKVRTDSDLNDRLTDAIPVPQP